MKLPEQTHIGTVGLRVRHLESVARFYEGLLGLKRAVSPTGATFFAGTAKLVDLIEQPEANPRRAFSAGLFHLAIRVPAEKDLARVFQHLQRSRYPFQGFSDHGVSKALYMADPEGNGVEIYWDRPKDAWPFEDGRLAMVTDPLDLETLIGTLTDQKEPWAGLPVGTDIGHIHLSVTSLAAARTFYHEMVGFDIVQDSYPGALFVSAGGYHHHVAVNTWTRAKTPVPEDETGLSFFELVVPDATARAGLQKISGSKIADHSDSFEVTDIDGIKIRIRS